MNGKNLKEAWQIEFKDRFLGNEKKENPIITVFLYIFIALLCFILVFIMIFQLCLVDGTSMLSTLNDGDHVLLTKTKNVEINDIVVIEKSDNLKNSYNIIKRVVAMPGDSIQFKTSNNKIEFYRKTKNDTEFKLINEQYINEPMKNLSSWVTAKPNSAPYTVKDGYVFVMGDNRNHSEDSRGVDGAYKISSIYGKMAMKVKRDSFLENILKFLYQESFHKSV